MVTPHPGEGRIVKPGPGAVNDSHTTALHNGSGDDEKSSVESEKGVITIERCSVENLKGAITIAFVQR